jgi:protein CWC15
VQVEAVNAPLTRLSPSPASPTATGCPPRTDRHGTRRRRARSRAARASSRVGTWLHTPSSSSGACLVFVHMGVSTSCSGTTYSQPGQTSTSDVAKRDLRAELALAEHEAKNKKRKAAGQPPLPWTAIGAGAAPLAIADAPAEDEEAHKRRKILQEALEMDRDDDTEDESVDEETAPADKAKPAADGSDDDDDDGDDSDDEDETAVLLRELEKIKRERAADQARADASAAASRDTAIATANPLLNLAAALGADAPVGVSTTAPGTFAVKRRWDDGAFQCEGRNDAPAHAFVRRYFQEPGKWSEGPVR